MAEGQQEQNIATVGAGPTVTRRSTASQTALTQGQAAAAVQNVVEVTMPWLLSSEQTMMALTTSGIDPSDLATNGAGALTISRYEGLAEHTSVVTKGVAESMLPPGAIGPCCRWPSGLVVWLPSYCDVYCGVLLRRLLRHLTATSVWRRGHEGHRRTTIVQRPRCRLGARVAREAAMQ